MKNGTTSKKLTLIDNADHEGLSEDPESRSGRRKAGHEHRGPSTAILFVIVCVACATAAVAAGSYAVWLTRQREATGTLTDVHQILKSCQDRIVQMEEDLDKLPNGRPNHAA